MLKRRLVVQAPAKVNLFLGIGTLENDGYHQADTILHTIDLCDILTVELHEGTGTFTVNCAPSLGITSQENLVHRAIVGYAQALGRAICADDEDLTIHIDKHIPSQAGLGGGSSDAAAALVAASVLWGQDSSSDSCLQVAQALGADVPFFLRGGCVHMSGRGDELVECFDPLSVPLVLIKPPEGVPTKEAYHRFDTNPVFAGLFDEKKISYEMLANQQRAGEKPTLDGSIAQAATEQLEIMWESLLSNNMWEAARSLVPALHDHLRWLSSQDGVLGSLLCGSGSALFAVCDREKDAQRICALAMDKGLWAVATKTRALGVAIL
jgi:4-diphosphocytidyl-2-C-methyl-D-erythritol kinase